MFDEIKARLKFLGYKMTPQRQAIIGLVTKPGPSLNAAEIWEHVRQQHPEISLDTVYRNLGILVEMGVLAPIAGFGKDGTRYEPAGEADHHHHIVCIKCGKAACIDICPISSQFLTVVKDQGYELVRHNIELFGICHKCKVGGTVSCMD